jgi:hypothetical protein
LDNLLKTVASKNMLGPEGSEQRANAEPETSKSPREKKDESSKGELPPKEEAKTVPTDEEEEEECMICMACPPDTVVTPCFHEVVCAECSLKLETTEDRAVCCQCRCEITGVYYPDNSVRYVRRE